MVKLPKIFGPKVVTLPFLENFSSLLDIVIGIIGVRICLLHELCPNKCPKRRLRRRLLKQTFKNIIFGFVTETLTKRYFHIKIDVTDIFGW